MAVTRSAREELELANAKLTAKELEDMEEQRKFMEVQIYHCFLCGPSYDSAVRPLPCCGVVVHEECVCQYWYDRVSLRCPSCPQLLYPLNDGEELPDSQFPGYLYFSLEFITWSVPWGLRPQWDRHYRFYIMQNFANTIREQNMLQE